MTRSTFRMLPPSPRISPTRRRHEASSKAAIVGVMATGFMTTTAFLPSCTLPMFSPRSTHSVVPPSKAPMREPFRSRDRRRRHSLLNLSRRSVSLAPDQSLPIAPLETVASKDSILRFSVGLNETINLQSQHLKDMSLNASDSSVKQVASQVETHQEELQQEPPRDNIDKLTYVQEYNSAGLTSLASPSVPISYDENGMVQAEATSFNITYINDALKETSNLNGNNSINQKNGTIFTSLASSEIIRNDEPEYPFLIKVLFQQDTNGQTLASKLFNLSLLLASFGYVFLSVVNIDHGMTRGWTPAEIGMRIPLDTWASYENSLSEKPVATKTIINIVIYLLGDWLSQTIFQKRNILDFDAGRTLKNGFIGMCFGPAVHEYYEFSDWILPVDGLTFGITNRAFKILMDQTIYLAVKCSIYILAIGMLNGDSIGTASGNVQNRIKPIMFAAWKFWPLVHCVTYGLIPARHRILWVNSVDLVWNAILASKARDSNEEPENSNEKLENNSNDKNSSINQSMAANGNENLFENVSEQIFVADEISHSAAKKCTSTATATIAEQNNKTISIDPAALLEDEDIASLPKSPAPAAAVEKK